MNAYFSICTFLWHFINDLVRSHDWIIMKVTYFLLGYKARIYDKKTYSEYNTRKSVWLLYRKSIQFCFNVYILFRTSHLLNLNEDVHTYQKFLILYIDSLPQCVAHNNIESILNRCTHTCTARPFLHFMLHCLHTLQLFSWVSD